MMKEHYPTPYSSGARAGHSCGAQFHLIPYVPKSKPGVSIPGRIEEQAHEALVISLEHEESRLDYNRHIGTLVQQEVDAEDLLSLAHAFGFQTPEHSKVSLTV